MEFFSPLVEFHFFGIHFEARERRDRLFDEIHFVEEIMQRHPIAAAGADKRES